MADNKSSLVRELRFSGVILRKEIKLLRNYRNKVNILHIDFPSYKFMLIRKIFKEFDFCYLYKLELNKLIKLVKFVYFERMEKEKRNFDKIILYCEQYKIAKKNLESDKRYLEKKQNDLNLLYEHFCNLHGIDFRKDDFETIYDYDSEDMIYEVMKSLKESNLKEYMRLVGKLELNKLYKSIFRILNKLAHDEQNYINCNSMDAEFVLMKNIKDYYDYSDINNYILSNDSDIFLLSSNIINIQNLYIIKSYHREIFYLFNNRFYYNLKNISLNIMLAYVNTDYCKKIIFVDTNNNVLKTPPLLSAMLNYNDLSNYKDYLKIISLENNIFNRIARKDIAIEELIKNNVSAVEKYLDTDDKFYDCVDIREEGLIFVIDSLDYYIDYKKINDIINTSNKYDKKVYFKTIDCENNSLMFKNRDSYIFFINYNNFNYIFRYGNSKIFFNVKLECISSSEYYVEIFNDFFYIK